MGAGAVEQRDVQFYLRRELLAYLRRDKPRAGGDFQQGSVLAGIPGERAADEALRCAYSAEPRIEHLQITKRSGHLSSGAGVGIEKFEAGPAFHSVRE